MPTNVPPMKDRTLSMSADLTDTVPMVGSKPGDWEHDSWLVTFHYGATDYSIPYHTGFGLRDSSGRPIPPKLGEILECVALDASMVHGNDFADFAGELGMPETPADLRSLLASYEASKEQTAKMEELVGSAVFWDAIVYGGPDNGWSSITTDTIELPDI